jgi:hypothetical protein
MDRVWIERLDILYLAVEFTLSAILANKECVGLVSLDVAFGELRDLELVRVSHRWCNVELVRGVRDVLVVELYSHPVFTCRRKKETEGKIRAGLCRRKLERTKSGMRPRVTPNLGTHILCAD